MFWERCSLGENLTTIIGIIVVVVAVAGAIGYMVMQGLKGTLRLNLDSLDAKGIDLSDSERVMVNLR